MTAGFVSSAKLSFKCISISLLLVQTQSLLVTDLAGTLCCHRCCLSAAPPLADFFIHMTRGQTSGQQGGLKLWQDKWVSQAEATGMENLSQCHWQNLPHLWPQETQIFHILRRNLYYHLVKILLCPASSHLLDWSDIHTSLAVGAAPQKLWTFHPEQSAGKHWTVTFHTWVTPASPDWILSSYICTLVLKAQLNWQIIHLQHCRGQECTISMIRCSAPTHRSYRPNFN